MKTIFRVFAYLRRYPLLGAAQLTCAVLMTLLVIVYPQVIKIVTGEVIPEKAFDRLIPLILLAGGAFLLTNIFNALRIILNNTFEQRVIYDLRSDLYSKIQRLPMPWFDNKRTGDVMTRVTEDVTAMERVLIDGIEQGVVAALQILVVGAYMFWQSPELAAIALIPMPLLIAGAVVYIRIAPERYRETRRTTSAMNSLLHDNIDGVQQIKSFTREEPEHTRFNQSSEAVRQATLRVMRIWAIYNPGMEFFRNLGYVLVLGFGGWWAMKGTLPPEILFAFLFALNLFYEPVSRLHQLNQIIQQGRAAAERVFEILDEEPELNADGGNELAKPVQGLIEFENVKFAYTEKAATLKGVTLEAQPGETIALVGHTGAGKSTIINLLTRFYEYDGGEIRIDGQLIADLSKRSMRDAIGYVTQESFLFNGTVRQNLELARANATDDEMWSALEAANAAKFVRNLPEKLETNVGERGVKLSVGEKQRISIARAILKNPPILLLDEATASVDNETEKLIQQALERLMSDRTCIVIAHRLSTVRNADKIYVLRNGEVIEEGPHATLMALDGEYARLSNRAIFDEVEEDMAILQ
ncbi:MAG: ABC transporter ATP-binding protein [Verrucomicrobiota bacterium]